MFRLIINGLFKLIKYLLNLLLLPTNALVVGAFPEFSQFINNFNNVVNNYIGNGITYFASMLPPLTRSTLIFYITVLIASYTITLTLHGILKIFTIIKNIKFW